MSQLDHYECRKAVSFKTGERIREGDGETHEDGEDDGADERADEALDRLLGRELDQGRLAERHAADVRPDVVADDQRGGQEEPDHALGKTVGRTKIISYRWLE
jgi:hypothetical protein